MLVSVLKYFIKLFYRVEIEGQYLGGKANGHNKTLIIANHSAFLDGILLWLFLPEQPVFVIHNESKKSRFFRFFLHFVDYVTVDTSHPMPMLKVIRLINQGRPAVIFPEGRVTITGSLMKLYSGAAFAALKTDATLIPVQITGSKFSHFSRLRGVLNPHFFPKIKLTIFPPTKLTVNETKDSDVRNQMGREEMHRLMMGMAVDSRERTTLFDMLLDATRKYGKDTFLYGDTLSDDLTYGSLVKKAVSLSTLLTSKYNLSKRVGVILPNSNVCVTTFYAMLHSGHTPVMINYTAGARAVNAGLKAAEVTTVISSKKFVKKGELEPLIESMNGCEIIYLEDMAASLTLKDKLNVLVKRNFPVRTAAKQNPEDEALVLFTSGTEGLPKGVVHSHDSLLTQLAQIKAIYDFNPTDRFMLCLPVFHVFGLMSAFALPITVGASGILYPSPLHYKVIPELIYEHSCSVLLSTSTFLAGYSRFAESYDFHSLRYVIAGAEKLSPEVVKTYHEKFGVRVMEGYGATETAPVIAAETTMAHKRGSVGRLVPGLIHRLEPVDGINEGGQLVVEADNVMMGYLRADNPGVIETPEIGESGKPIYDTGDIAVIDEYGYVFLKGRIKRFAKIAGEMVSLDTVEKMAEYTSPEASHAAITIADRRKGEAIHLFTTDETMTRRMLQHSAKALAIPKLAVPKTLQVVGEIPVFASGKTNYPALTELLEK